MLHLQPSLNTRPPQHDYSKITATSVSDLSCRQRLHLRCDQKRLLAWAFTSISTAITLHTLFLTKALHWPASAFIFSSYTMIIWNITPGAVLRCGSAPAPSIFQPETRNSKIKSTRTKTPEQGNAVCRERNLHGDARFNLLALLPLRQAGFLPAKSDPYGNDARLPHSSVHFPDFSD